MRHSRGRHYEAGGAGGVSEEGAARRPLDVARAYPCGEFGRIGGEHITHDRIKLAHGVHASLNLRVNCGGGGDLRPLALSLTLYRPFHQVYIRL
ncbi:MAG TPA: hypothetical protein VGO69_07300 [Pyrinomonadaceae bacterium]|nr:hypothetical protein [Pyrinomonadaceae bacterium]